VKEKRGMGSDGREGKKGEGVGREEEGEGRERGPENGLPRAHAGSRRA